MRAAQLPKCAVMLHAGMLCFARNTITDPHIVQVRNLERLHELELIPALTAKRIWAHNGVAVTTHAALVPDLAADLQRLGFSRIDQQPGKALAKRGQQLQRQQRTPAFAGQRGRRR